jgi:uncharacterized protein (DUF486 family)
MMLSPQIAPILLLLISNMFMTTAWYGHLKFPAASMLAAISVSWGIAFFEYCLAVPANRIGYAVYSAGQLKAMQEVISIAVFVGFSILVLGEDISTKQIFGFVLLAAGAFFVFDGS